MSTPDSLTPSPPPPGCGCSGGHDAEKVFRLLRNSHIFSSVVREILGAKYLSEVSDHPLTQAQFSLLKLISESGERQIGEVADVLGFSAPAASKNIDKLERLGLVERRSSESDRRVTLLVPSPQGRQLVDRYEELKRTRLAPVLARFEPEEIGLLTQLLKRFSTALFQAENEGRDFCLRCAAYCESHCAVGHVQGSCPYDKLEGRGPQTRPVAEVVP
jgi:DNA-binding MarR family transcriptional regulator